MKGMSPLISIILLVAIAVAVAGIISTWISSYTKTTTSQVGEKSSKEINCVYGDLSFQTVSYCNGYLYGNIKNTGMVDLSNITVQIIYANASFESIELCKSGISVITCSQSNLTLKQGEEIMFNVSASSNYKKILTYSLTCPTKGDSIESSYVSSC